MKKILKRLLLLPGFIIIWFTGVLLLMIWAGLTLSLVPVMVNWVITGDTKWWLNIFMVIFDFLNDFDFNIK